MLPHLSIAESCISNVTAQIKQELFQSQEQPDFKNWTVVEKSVKLEPGQHVLKLVIDGDLFNLDKMVFEEMK